MTPGYNPAFTVILYYSCSNGRKKEFIQGEVRYILHTSSKTY